MTLSTAEKMTHRAYRSFSVLRAKTDELVISISIL